MQIVCPDLDGVSSWVYDPSTMKYMRILPNGTISPAEGGRLLARLAGADIPNPDALWLYRCKSAGVATTSIQGAQFRPSPITYSLWNHWQGMKNA